MRVRKTITPQPWMTAAASAAVLAALGNDSDSPVALFVGGCVRDALLGRSVQDIDIATVLAPDEVLARLARAGIAGLATGLEHGTVTAVVEAERLEITTLRVDVETDGRHAEVAFTEDWAGDARRRDFTINALFCNAGGEVFDPFGGIDDLAAGRVRFVGDAETRIREDVLRLLRFFRFQAHYGTPPPDADGLAACARLAPLLSGLSAERVAGELLRLLAAPAPAATLELMVAHGVLETWLPEARAFARLAALVTVEGVSVGADAVRRLAAVLESDAGGAAAVAARWRLANAARDRLVALAGEHAALAAEMPAAAARRALYGGGAARWADRVLLAWAGAIVDGGPLDRRASEAWQSLLALPERWPLPALPVGGADAIALGVAAGPAVGRLLKAVEAWWVDGGFAADRPACLVRLAELAGAPPAGAESA